MVEDAQQRVEFIDYPAADLHEFDRNFGTASVDVVAARSTSLAIIGFDL